jgi:hypothetical protein
MNISDYFLVWTRLQAFINSLLEQRKRVTETFLYTRHQQRFNLSSNESVKNNVIGILSSDTSKYILAGLLILNFTPDTQMSI